MQNALRTENWILIGKHDGKRRTWESETGLLLQDEVFIAMIFGFHKNLEGL
jgi:hypothetical protein